MAAIVVDQPTQQLIDILGLQLKEKGFIGKATRKNVVEFLIWSSPWVPKELGDLKLQHMIKVQTTRPHQKDTIPPMTPIQDLIAKLEGIKL